MSRPVFALRSLPNAMRDPARLEALRGGDPIVVALWMESTRLASMTSYEDGLAVVHEGLGFLRADPSLMGAEIELLEVQGRHHEALAAAERALASLPPQPLRPSLRHAALRNRLALGQVDDAAYDARRLQGTLLCPPQAKSDAWARVALGLALLGRLEESDAAYDLSLGFGTTGVGTLLEATATRPESLAAARAVRDRALERHPRHPDLLLTAVVDAMEREGGIAAQERFDALPGTMPARLESDVVALRGRILILRGDVEAGLDVLRARLDTFPADRPSLAVLEESWRLLGRPGDVEYAFRLRAARATLRNPVERQRIDTVLKAIEERRAMGLGTGEEARPGPPAPGATPTS